LVQSVSHTQALQRGLALAVSRWVLNHLLSFAARAGPAKFSRVCGSNGCHRGALHPGRVGAVQNWLNSNRNISMRKM
jgi:hypothetical protein